MSFRVCIKTEKSLQQLASEICSLFSLPSYRLDTFAGDPYYHFEMLGLLILVHRADEEDRDPEVRHYPYCFDLQMSFADHHLDTDDIEYRLQPYYAQLLCFHLGLDTAYHERQRIASKWRIRYRFCRKNARWNGAILYGEPGWEPAVLENTPSEWRFMQPAL